MRPEAPFQPDDLVDLDALLASADQVVPMDMIAAGETSLGVIGLRHDVDNVIEPAVAMAEWEAERGYNSTYFILHTAPYWQNKYLLERSLERIAACGHEIGFHLNAITAAIETGRDPFEILEEAVAELRGYGYHVTGVVAHGDNACYQYGFVNDELFVESARPDHGAPDRVVGGVKLDPVSREQFGFEYDASWLSRAAYLSDSGGKWSQPFEDVRASFPYDGQLHMLVHADWWPQAFPALKAIA
jgi:hypothetical protein